MQHIEPLTYGNYYHIYNRGINSCNLFREKDNYRYFTEDATNIPRREVMDLFGDSDNFKYMHDQKVYSETMHDEMEY